jgi:hypothetical protein
MGSIRASFAVVLATVSIAVAGCDGAGNPATGTGDGGSSSGRRTCSDFGSQSAAQADFNAGNRGLDGDGDGVACEALK